MRTLRSSVKPVRWESGWRSLRAATIAAACLFPSAAAAQSATEFESRTDLALDAAARALADEERRLDALAVQYSARALSDGGPSSGQAAANIRLWDNAIRDQKTKEGQLLSRIENELDQLRPEISSLTRRLSAVVTPPAPPSAALSLPAPSEFEERIERALIAAREALADEERRLDELAAHNSRVTLSDGRTSSGQAAASIRLWNNAIEEQQTDERQLLARIEDELDRLGPEISSLAGRLSTLATEDTAPPPGTDTIVNGRDKPDRSAGQNRTNDGERFQ